MNEIERKFLLNVDLPTLLEGTKTHPDKWGNLVDECRIEQHYLTDTGEWNIRVRKRIWYLAGEWRHCCVQTMKRRITDRKCWEVEEPITTEAFDFLAGNLTLSSPALIKNRYEIKYKGFIWEVDQFLNPEYSDMLVAEIELESEDQMFPLPFWVGKDITGDKHYRNARMAKKIKG